MPASTEKLLSAAEVSQLLGEELVSRAEQQYELGQRLLSQAVKLEARASGVDTMPEEERSVGKRGAVTFDTAVAAAARLETFTRAEYGEVLGLNPTATSKWISRLVNNTPHPILVRMEDTSPPRYRYIIPTKTAPNNRPSHAASVERQAGVGTQSQAKGVPVAHTRAVGGTGKPGADKKLAEKGYKVKRRRQGT